MNRTPPYSPSPELDQSFSSPIKASFLQKIKDKASSPSLFKLGNSSISNICKGGNSSTDEFTQAISSSCSLFKHINCTTDSIISTSTDISRILAKNIFGNFTRNIAVTRYPDISSPNLASPNVEHSADPLIFETHSCGDLTESELLESQEKYNRHVQKFELTVNLNSRREVNDPLTYAQERLWTFFETYKIILTDYECGKNSYKTLSKSYDSDSGSDSDISSSYSDFSISSIPTNDVQTTITQSSLYSRSTIPISKNHKHSSDLSERIDHIGFWSICALKLITGLDSYLTNTVLKNFQNYKLKFNQRLRIFYTQEEFFGQQWSWQFAFDNPDADIYEFITHPKIKPPPCCPKPQFTQPKNLTPVYTNSLREIPFPDCTFALSVCYDLWLQLKETEWDPILKEIHRILSPAGQLNLLLYDFDLINCTNVKYRSFYEQLHKILIKRGVDIYPTRHIHERLKDAGFEHVRYTCVALKKGIPTPMGNLLDFLQCYFEFIIFDKIANFEMNHEDLEEFKNIKLQYHDAIKNGLTLNDMGCGFCMLVFAEKKSSK